jgi:hypothetical protein
MWVSNPSVFRRSYDEDGRVGADGYSIISPYGSEEEIAYGEGAMEPPSAGLRGTVVWSNYPRRRADGCMLPNVRGLITTQDGASILFEFRGRMIFGGDEPGSAEPCRLVRVRSRKLPRLNGLVCIAEGGISATGPDMVINVYAGIHEMLAQHNCLFQRRPQASSRRRGDDLATRNMVDHLLSGGPVPPQWRRAVMISRRGS